MLARYQFTVQDAAGNTLPGASVEVRHEVTGAPLAALYSDRAGTVAMGNPITADADGFVYFHVVGGAYKIVATSGASSRTWRYVGIGLASESDGQAVGVPFVFDTATADSDPGAGYLRLNNATLASVTKIFADNTAANSGDVSAWLDTFDDIGDTTNRGLITITARNNQALLIGRVTGLVANDTGYRDITVEHVVSTGAFVAGDIIGVTFVGSGADGADGAGSGDVVGPASAVTARIAVFNGTTGKLIADGGSVLADFAATAVGQGKQLLAWVPAGAMTPNTTNGPASATTELATNKNMVKTLAFDTTTSESAQFSVGMPKKWNEGTVTFVPYWMHAATTTNFGVVWALSGVAVSNDDTLDVAFGTAANSADTGGTTSDLYIGPESAAITIGGTPAEIDMVNFKIARLPADASDTMAIDALLIGVKVFYTTNAATEA